MTAEFRHGLAAGSLGILWIASVLALGFPTGYLILGAHTAYGSIVLLPVLLWRLLRRGERPAHATFLAGLQVSLIAALMTCTFLTAYNKMLRPPWIDDALERQVAHWRSAGVGEPTIREKITAIRRVNTPLGIVVNTGLPLLGTGALFAAVLAQRARKK